MSVELWILSEQFFEYCRPVPHFSVSSEIFSHYFKSMRKSPNDTLRSHPWGPCIDHLLTFSTSKVDKLTYTASFNATFQELKEMLDRSVLGVYGGINISVLKFSFRLLSKSLALCVEELSSKIDKLLFLKIRLLLIYFFKSTKDPVKVSASTESEQRWIKYFLVEIFAAIFGMDSLKCIDFISAFCPFLDHE